MTTTFPRVVTSFPLPPDMEAVLLNPDWSVADVAAWRYWWPLSEQWTQRLHER